MPAQVFNLPSLTKSGEERFTHAMPEESLSEIRPGQANTLALHSRG